MHSPSTADENALLAKIDADPTLRSLSPEQRVSVLTRCVINDNPGKLDSTLSIVSLASCMAMMLSPTERTVVAERLRLEADALMASRQ
jgi:hypothetical protein